MRLVNLSLSVLAVISMTSFGGYPQTAPRQSGFELAPRSYSELVGFDRDDHLEAWKTFVRSCQSVASSAAELRAGLQPSQEFRELCIEALKGEVRNPTEARHFFETRFQPFEIVTKQPDKSVNRAFLTGYYEPVIAGSRGPTLEHSEPILGRPDDLVTLDPGVAHTGIPVGLSSARLQPDSSLAPYPTRREIDAGAISERAKPIVWVKDAIEVFMIQVQGSAVIELPDGNAVRLTYAGRNGHPYTSIGRVLVESGEVPIEEMSLARLKQWVRTSGQRGGERGRELLHRNESYVFFAEGNSGDRSVGPIGAQGVPLLRLRSIAVDRGIWPYGLPFWIDAELPWTGENAPKSVMQRLMIAQDTGSAIIGSARADIFFGSGDTAGSIAGGIRHYGRMVVLLPKNAANIKVP